mgnify:CR=1 FL=1
MSEHEIYDFVRKVDLGLAEAQHDMLVEKALYNRDVVMSDGKGGVVEVSAKQLLADKA